MKVAILGECSGIIRDAFIARGHDAVSCDLKPSRRPGPHIQGDYMAVDWTGFDLGIMHPDCTYLACSGLHWNKRRPERQAKTDAAATFAIAMMDLPFRRKAMENPIGCLSTRYRRPDQIIQPWQFGDDASKATCLWLENLPKLVATNPVLPRLVCCGLVVPNTDKYGCPNCNGENKPKPRWGNQTNSGQNKLGPSPLRQELRSNTYPGVAQAMAEQWGSLPTSG